MNFNFKMFSGLGCQGVVSLMEGVEGEEGVLGVDP